MRRTVLVLLGLLLLAPGASADEDPAPPSAARDASALLRGDAETWSALRAHLAAGSKEEALAALDAVRREVEASAGPVPAAVDLAPHPLLDPAAREEAGLLVRALREERPWIVEVETHFLRLRPDRATSALGEHAPGRKGSIRPVPDAVALALLGDHGARALARPWVPGAEAFDGQTVTMLCQSRIRYLMDHEVESGSGEVRPLVGLMPDGVRLDVTVHRLPGEERLRLDVRADAVALVRPVPRFRALDPALGLSVDLQLPEFRLLDLRESVEVPMGGWVLVALPTLWPNGEAEQTGALLRAIPAPPPPWEPLDAADGLVPAPPGEAPGEGEGACGG